MLMMSILFSVSQTFICSPGSEHWFRGPTSWGKTCTKSCESSISYKLNRPFPSCPRSLLGEKTKCNKTHFHMALFWKWGQVFGTKKWPVFTKQHWKYLVVNISYGLTEHVLTSHFFPKQILGSWYPTNLRQISRKEGRPQRTVWQRTTASVFLSEVLGKQFLYSSIMIRILVDVLFCCIVQQLMQTRLAGWLVL